MEQTTDHELMDNYSEKTYKRLKLVYFTIKALLIGLIVFTVTQTAFYFLVVSKDREGDNEAVVITEDDTVGHNYCGTFFIDGTYGFYYGCVDNYQAMKAEKDSTHSVLMGVASTSAIVMIAGIIVSAWFFFRNASKKQLFYKRSSKWILFSGMLLAAYNIIAAIFKYSEYIKDKEYYVGIMSESSYYLQIYHILALPALFIMLGLILRKHEHMIRGENKDAVVLNLYSLLFSVISFGFILIRVFVRIYELICALAEWDNDSMLPFYNMLIPLPRGLAKNIDSYTNVILFRFIKDVPVFAASAVSVVLLTIVMFNCAKGQINTESNRHKLKLCMISLTVASVLFNLMGIHEVTLFNNGFNGIFGNVTYTMGIRGLCEPALYAFAIYVVYVFIKLVPSEDEETRRITDMSDELAVQTI